jgi:hypothetical protein
LPMLLERNLPMALQPTTALQHTNVTQPIKLVNSDCVIMMFLFTTHFLSFVSYTN